MNVWSRGVPIIPCFTDQLNTTIKLPTNSILPSSYQPTQYYQQVTNQLNTTIKLPTNAILPSSYQPTQYYHQFINQLNTTINLPTNNLQTSHVLQQNLCFLSPPTTYTHLTVTVSLVILIAPYSWQYKPCRANIKFLPGRNECCYTCSTGEYAVDWNLCADLSLFWPPFQFCTPFQFCSPNILKTN